LAVSSRSFSLGAGDQDVLAHARTSAEIAIGELVWNALDADATVVRIDRHRAVPGGPVTSVVVADDGHGIGPHELQAAFETHRTSPKKSKRTSPRGRPMHGRNGRGRFRSFAVASSVRWRTWGEDELGNVAGNEVELQITSATRGTIRDIGEPGDELDDVTGTRVLLHLADTQKAGQIGDDTFHDRLEAVLAATLLSLDGVLVVLDGKALDPASQIEAQAQPEVVVDLTDVARSDDEPAGDPVLEVIEWKSSKVDPCLYLCDEDGSALIEYAGRLPKAPGVEWSGYLRWEGFARDTVEEGDLQNARATFGPIIDAAIVALSRHLTERSETLVGDDIKRWIEDGSYPYQVLPETPLEEAEQEAFRELVALARKAVPADREQRQMSLGLMNSTFKESPDDALQVIAEVKGLDEDEVREFRELLKRTPLSRVIHTSKQIADRVDFLVALDELLHDEALREEFLETEHLHRLVERNPWIFGNQWGGGLLRSEAGLVSAMREHLAVLRPGEPPQVTAADIEGSRRRVDLLFAGTVQEHRRRRRLVVELKRASLVLDRKERNQIEGYADALTTNPKFQGDPCDWEFWLLGTDIHSNIESSVNRKDQSPGLYNEYDLPAGGTCRIWIRPWSSVLDDARSDLAYYQDQLGYDPDVDDALDGIRARYPDAVPPA
jgi:hypothetical protein